MHAKGQTETGFASSQRPWSERNSWMQDSQGKRKRGLAATARRFASWLQYAPDPFGRLIATKPSARFAVAGGSDGKLFRLG